MTVIKQYNPTTGLWEKVLVGAPGPTGPSGGPTGPSGPSGPPGAAFINVDGGTATSISFSGDIDGGYS